MVGSYDRTNERKIHSMTSTEVDVIGKEKKLMRIYIGLIARLMGMSEKLQEHFLSQCKEATDDIHIILGQKDGAVLMHDIIPEQLGLKQHPLLPNVKLYRNPLNNSLVIAGDMGVKEELVDDDYPTLHVHKDIRAEMKREMENAKPKTKPYSFSLEVKSSFAFLINRRTF